MTGYLREAAAAIVVASLCAGVAQAQGTVEVSHWWTSGGEAKAVGELKTAFRRTRRDVDRLRPSPAAGGMRQ